MRALAGTTLIALGLAFAAVACRARVEPSATQAAPGPPRAADRRAPNASVPSRPVPDGAVPPRPCGVEQSVACPMLVWESYHWAFGHSAWFMDTAGNEYEFAYTERKDHSGWLPDVPDLLRLVETDGVITASDFALVVAASKALPRRVTAAEARHALALLVASRSGSVETLEIPGCSDAGSSAIDGYLFETRWNGSVARRLETFDCDPFPSQRNNTLAALELTQWIQRIRYARATERGRK